MNQPAPGTPGTDKSATLLARQETLKRLRHDLRTPLNQIIGYSEMLLEAVAESGPKVLFDDLQRLLHQGNDILGLLNEALSQRKIETDTVDLPPLRHRLANPLSGLLGLRDICEEAARNHALSEVLADLAKIGLAAHNLRKLLEKETFSQRYPLNPGGAAIGPAATVAPFVLGSRNPVGEASSQAISGRILVVDDEPLNREMLMRRLDKIGFSVSGAEHGLAALEALQREPFDLVLLDILMPVMDGFQTLERLKLDPKFRHIPVVMLTALDEVESTVRCIEAGAEDYIPKPFNPVVLQARIGAYMERKRLRDQERAFLAQLQAERAKSDRLLLNILPKAIGERLKAGEQTIVDAVPEATVLFADIVGFTRIAATLAPAQTVALLNEIFSDFDQLAEQTGVEKVKTIGDSYMVVCGVPIPVADHAIRCADMALQMLDVIDKFNRRNGHRWTIRIGMHSGPLVAGIIGYKKFAYDLWGDTVNIASRLESHGEPGVPQVSAATAEKLSPLYLLEQRGMVELKNRGEMMAYRLLGKA